MLQKRKYVRVCFPGRAELLVEEPHVDVVVSNISMGGLHLHCERALNLGDRVRLRMHHHEGELPFEEVVHGRVVVVHRRSEAVSYGVQFMPNLDIHLQPGLHHWISAHSQNDAVSFLRNTIP